MFNVKKARALAALITPEQSRKMLIEGPKWAGAGWTTSGASSVLWNLVGIPFVAAEVSAYRDIWLSALARVHNVEIGSVTLSGRASEAAFALSSLISQSLLAPKPLQSEKEEPNTKERQHCCHGLG